MTDQEENKIKESPSLKEYATEQSEYIMECIVNKDKEGLKSVFSKNIAETHDLDKEIDEFFDFIDGEIISYDEPEGHEGGYAMKDGEYTDKKLYGWTENVISDTGKEYDINFLMYEIYTSNEKNIGVKRITITDKTDGNDEKKHIGEIG